MQQLDSFITEFVFLYYYFWLLRYWNSVFLLSFICGANLEKPTKKIRLKNKSWHWLLDDLTSIKLGLTEQPCASETTAKSSLAFDKCL